MTYLENQKIQERFNKAYETYDKYAFIQQKSSRILAKLLLARCANFNFKQIIDAGCGTGYMTEILIQAFPNATFILNDNSESMLQIAKHKLLHGTSKQNFEFYLDNMEEANFKDSDLIISNLAVQWTNIEHVIKKFYSQARFVSFSCPIKNTFIEWYNFLLSNNLNIKPIPYKTFRWFKKIIKSLDCINYQIYTKKFSIQFDSAIEFMKYLKNTGTGYAQFNCEKQYRNIKKIVNNKNKIKTHFHILFALIQKY